MNQTVFVQELGQFTNISLTENRYTPEAKVVILKINHFYFGIEKLIITLFLHHIFEYSKSL